MQAYIVKERTERKCDPFQRQKPPPASVVTMHTDMMAEAGKVGKTKRGLLWVTFTADDHEPEKFATRPTEWHHVDLVFKCDPECRPGFTLPRVVKVRRFLAGTAEFLRLVALLRWEDVAAHPRLAKLCPPMRADQWDALTQFENRA